MLVHVATPPARAPAARAAARPATDVGIKQQGLQQRGDQRRVVRRQQFPGWLLAQALPSSDARAGLHRGAAGGQSQTTADIGWLGCNRWPFISRITYIHLSAPISMTAHCSQHDLSACDARLTRPFFGNGTLK
jgi:hypothetical protein